VEEVKKLRLVLPHATSLKFPAPLESGGAGRRQLLSDRLIANSIRGEKYDRGALLYLC
jgi:hypothetical protein